MEDVLKFEEIADYLPYKVPFKLNEKGIFNLDCEYGVPYEAHQEMFLQNLTFGSDGVEVEIHSDETNWGVGFVGLDEVKLVLKKAEDLTREEFIEIGVALAPAPKNVEEIEKERNVVFRNDDRDEGYGRDFLGAQDYSWVFGSMNWNVKSVLSKLHFDYNNLIDRGLAERYEAKPEKSV